MPENATVAAPETATHEEEIVLMEVLRAIRSLSPSATRGGHGSVQIFVQDGRVVQIDTLEKKRFDRG